MKLSYVEGEMVVILTRSTYLHTHFYISTLKLELVTLKMKELYNHNLEVPGVDRSRVIRL